LTQSAWQRGTALADRLATTWRERRAGSQTGATGPNRDLELRVEALATRMEHLEAAFEALQDALYRQAVREDETRADLQRRTEPSRIARELSADARRRGL
jgi:hypothetical protein